jgi:hypothetical protein
MLLVRKIWKLPARKDLSSAWMTVDAACSRLMPTGSSQLYWWFAIFYKKEKCWKIQLKIDEYLNISKIWGNIRAGILMDVDFLSKSVRVEAMRTWRDVLWILAEDIVQGLLLMSALWSYLFPGDGCDHRTSNFIQLWFWIWLYSVKYGDKDPTTIHNDLKDKTQTITSS